MDSNNTKRLQYPLGEFDYPSEINLSQINNWINDIESFPIRLEKLVSNLDKHQLKLTYRPNGWTIAQVVHHCADSHMNSFIRFKLALTEDHPTIKPYYEDRWAEMTDYQCDINYSLQLLYGLHKRWTVLLKSLNHKDYAKTFLHPANNQTTRLDTNIGIYAWHCNHHLAHIELALQNINFNQ